MHTMKFHKTCECCNGKGETVKEVEIPDVITVSVFDSDARVKYVHSGKKITSKSNAEDYENGRMFIFWASYHSCGRFWDGMMDGLKEYKENKAD